ncbi:MAG: hypothetical protein WCQ49_02180 [Candidatus Saccharibacteria bacterium]
MSQSEYQIPTSKNSSVDEVIIRDQLNTIYVDQVNNNEVSNQSELAGSVAERLYAIADDLNLARESHLNSSRAEHAATKTKIIKYIGKFLFNNELSSSYNEIITERELKIEEGEIGASIFGAMAPNERRAFFNDNRESWFFYQEKTDASKIKHSITLHYEVKPEGILRVSNQAGMQCEMISGKELSDFIKATEIYYSRVKSAIYKNKDQSGHNLAA